MSVNRQNIILKNKKINALYLQFELRFQTFSWKTIFIENKFYLKTPSPYIDQNYKFPLDFQKLTPKTYS